MIKSSAAISIFLFPNTAMPTCNNLDGELRRREKKIASEADLFQTQVVYDAEKTVTFLDRANDLGKPVLIGIMPLKSVKMARYMNDTVDGIEVPHDILMGMEKTKKPGFRSPVILSKRSISMPMVFMSWPWEM